MSVLSASEINRLGKLADYQILDTPPEREFDEITQIAAKLIGTPISLVSLIDRDRQWFKARYGLNASETPVEHAFCAHAIKGDTVYVVTDATQNPLFAENPLVTGAPDIRFYAGAPLITSDKFHLGTLCVIDTKPREMLSTDAEKILELLARMVVNALESRRATMRAQHQVRMMTRLAESTVAASQTRSLAELARVLTDSARGLVVGEAACFQALRGDGEPVVATRSGLGTAAPPQVDWRARGESLVARKLLSPATSKDLSALDGVKGSWIGFLIGMDGNAPVGHLQVWRQHTTTYTELEAAMLTDLARVASGAAERLSGH
jgi:GAF domain-containing protein